MGHSCAGSPVGDTSLKLLFSPERGILFTQPWVTPVIFLAGILFMGPRTQRPDSGIAAWRRIRIRRPSGPALDECFLWGLACRRIPRTALLCR